MDKDLTAQANAFDPVLSPPGVPDAVVVDADGIPRIRLRADHAASVSLIIERKTYECRQENSVWTAPLPACHGFTYVQVLIDGDEVLSPYLPIAFGCSRPYNYIALPEEDGDFYRLKDVPHGSVRREYFHSSVTGDWASCLVYVPAEYEAHPERRYPVLYLQHGHGENETGWVYSGKANLILDNLIAEGQAVPFLVVMNAGMVQTRTASGQRAVDHLLLPRMIVEDVIPFIDGKYRTLTDREHRAMAGLSMGSMQTSITGFTHPELFSYLGLFSGFLRDFIAGNPAMDPIDRAPSDNAHLKALDDPAAFAEHYKVFFRGIGEDDHLIAAFLEDDDILKTAGVACIRKMYQGGHDWNVWRRCLRDFAPLIFC